MLQDTTLLEHDLPETLGLDKAKSTPEAYTYEPKETFTPAEILRVLEGLPQGLLDTLGPEITAGILGKSEKGEIVTVTSEDGLMMFPASGAVLFPQHLTSTESG